MRMKNVTSISRVVAFGCVLVATWGLAPGAATPSGGDNCGGSPGTIGAYIGSGSTRAYQIVDITQVQQDVVFNGATIRHRNAGWIYKTATGAEYWEATPGTPIGTPFGAPVRVLAFSEHLGYDPRNAIMRITPIAANKLFKAADTVAIRIRNASGVFHSKGCFTADWIPD